jgi:hypothetical protein
MQLDQTFYHIIELLQAFMILYSQILEHGGPAFGTILRHVRDKPNSPFIFHCTGSSILLFIISVIFQFVLAGKDRTGIIAAILLKVNCCRYYSFSS